MHGSSASKDSCHASLDPSNARSAGLENGLMSSCCHQVPEDAFSPLTLLGSFPIRGPRSPEGSGDLSFPHHCMPVKDVSHILSLQWHCPGDHGELHKCLPGKSLRPTTRHTDKLPGSLRLQALRPQGLERVHNSPRRPQ